MGDCDQDILERLYGDGFEKEFDKESYLQSIQNATCISDIANVELQGDVTQKYKS